MAENKRLPELLNTDSIVVSLMESTNGTIRIRNKALLLDEETGNGRIYPLSVVSEAIKEAEPRMRAGECLCTVNGHPADVYPEPDIASHYVVKAWIEGKYLMCESVVMGDTQYGKTLMGLITGGAAIGI